MPRPRASSAGTTVRRLRCGCLVRGDGGVSSISLVSARMASLLRVDAASSLSKAPWETRTRPPRPGPLPLISLISATGGELWGSFAVGCICRPASHKIIQTLVYAAHARPATAAVDCTSVRVGFRSSCRASSGGSQAVDATRCLRALSAPKITRTQCCRGSRKPRCGARRAEPLRPGREAAQRGPRLFYVTGAVGVSVMGYYGWQIRREELRREAGERAAEAARCGR